MNKKKNPLYVVSEKNGIVEEAFGKLDFIIKKLGLTPFVNYLKEIISQLLATVQSYQAFVVVKTYIDQILNQLTALLMKFAK